MAFPASLRQAVRSLLRRPGFTAVAILTTGLALGANTAIFSVVHGTLLRPLPFQAPEQLVKLEVRARTGFLVSISVPNYRSWRDRSRVFESYAGAAGWTLRLTGRGPAEILEARAVLGDLFGTLGLSAEAGRLFTAEETPDHAGGAPVVVLGHSYWQQRFGGDRAILGQTLRLGGVNYSVIGVLPPEAGFPDPGVQVYVPMATLRNLPWEDRDSGFGTEAIARLRSGVDLEGAAPDIGRVNREVASEVGKTAVQIELVGLSAWYLGDVGTRLWILMGAVGFVLLIAIANIGNLLLARGEDRQRELAVRAALGAGRGALVRLLVGEAMLLALGGALLGGVVAFTAVRAMVPLLPAEIPAVLRAQIGVNGTVLLFGSSLALLAGLLFGLIPAFRATRLRLSGVVAGGARTTESHRLRSALVVVEVALALVLLVSAGLMLKILDRLIHVDKGFEARNVATAAVSPAAARIPDPESWRGYYRQLLLQAEAIPGVRRAGFALLLPLSHRSWELRLHPEGVPVEAATAQSVLYNIVTPGYFATLQLPLLRGREFAPGDREGANPVAVIDETMAARFWPGQDPIGKRITFEVDGDSAGAAPVYRTVVGVVKNLRHYELLSPSRIQVYVPLDQSARRWGMGMRILLQTDRDPALVEAPLRSALAQLDRDASLWQVRSLQSYVDDATAESRAMTRVLGAFAAGALALAGLGIFGVMSYVVARRTREIGIRIALGAEGRDVLRWIGRRATRLTAAGLALGGLGSLLLTRLLRQVLFEVRPLDGPTYLWVTLVLGATALAAAWVPARRALRVDPVQVMKDEG